MGKKVKFEHAKVPRRGNGEKRRSATDKLLMNFAVYAQVQVLNIERIHGRKGDHIQITARLQLMSDGLTEQLQAVQGVKRLKIDKAPPVDLGQMSVKWTVPA